MAFDRVMAMGDDGAPVLQCQCQVTQLKCTSGTSVSGEPSTFGRSLHSTWTRDMLNDLKYYMTKFVQQLQPNLPVEHSSFSSVCIRKTTLAQL